MASFGHLVVFAFLAVLPIFGAGDTCLSPKVDSKVYTTTETTASAETVVIVEFSVACKNGIKDMNLYAEFNGKAIPASKVGNNKYQVSFSDEHKKIPSGNYEVRLFDDEGYSILRKAQRGGEDTVAVKSFFSVPVYHAGASKGPWVQSEFVAAMVGIIVWYSAYHARSKLQTTN